MDGIGAQLMRKCVRRASSSALQLACDCGHGSGLAIAAIVTSPRLRLLRLWRAHVRLQSPRPGGRSGEVCSHQAGPATRRGAVSPRIRVASARRSCGSESSARRCPSGHTRGAEPPASRGNLARRVHGTLVLRQRIWKGRRTRRASGYAAPPNKRIQQARRSARLGGRHRRAADAQMR